MRSASLLLGLAAAAVTTAFPASSPSVQDMHTALAASDQCKLPEPDPSCSGASRKDVIVMYGDQISEEQQTMLLDAAKSAGSEIVYEWKIGYSGFVPDSVVELIKAHGEGKDVKVYDNACTEIPWCGEAPC